MRYLFPLSPYNQQRQYEKEVWVYPVHLAMYATWLKEHAHQVEWGCPLDDEGYSKKELENEYDSIVIQSDEDIEVPFNQLPYPDRTFTDAKNPRWQSYGNYKHHPATHMMASNLCWYGKCSFCIDKQKLDNGEKRYVRPVNHVIEEVDNCIKLGFKEIFDDSGTFPTGKWLEDFCAHMSGQLIRRYKRVTLGCNLKPISLDYELMKASGFRMILVGLESANQSTVEKLNKGISVDDAVLNIIKMSEAGLEPHITVMFYDWETHEEAMKTVNLVHYLLKKGYAKTVQASVCMPPRTAPNENHRNKQYVQKVYDVYKHPAYWYRKIRDIKDLHDLTYLLKRIDHIWRAK